MLSTGAHWIYAMPEWFIWSPFTIFSVSLSGSILSFKRSSCLLLSIQTDSRSSKTATGLHRPMQRQIGIRCPATNLQWRRGVLQLCTSLQLIGPIFLQLSLRSNLKQYTFYTVLHRFTCSRAGSAGCTSQTLLICFDCHRRWSWLTLIRWRRCSRKPPKKAKARDTTSTSDLFLFNFVQLRSTSFDFVRLQLFQGNQMIWHDFSILIWHDLTQTCRVSTDVAMPLHGSWIRLARMCLVQISTLHKRPAHFWLLSIDTSNHMAPRHHWGGYIYIYILTSMKTVVKGKASGQQVLLFPWRPMTETIPLLQTFSQWVWLDTGWKPRVKTNQSRMSRLSPLCYSQKLPYWTSADVRLLTAKFPYRAEIFDDEVWDGLWSSFYQFSYRFFANSTSVETSISITTLQAGDNWVGSPKMKEPMVSGASYWGYQYYTV